VNVTYCIREKNQQTINNKYKVIDRLACIVDKVDKEEWTLKLYQKILNQMNQNGIDKIWGEKKNFSHV